MAKRNVTIEDMFQFSLFSRPLISPDGTHVLYEKTQMRQDENDYHTELWLTDLNGKTNQLLIEEEHTMDAAWSPDGRSIAYLTKVSQKTQLCYFSLDHQRSKRFTVFKYPLSSLTFAPDGKNIYALLPVKDQIEVWTDESENNQITKRAYESLYYKFDGIGFHDGTKKQIININIDSGDIQLITDGRHHIKEFAVSPDGKQIAYIAVDQENDTPLYNGTLYELDLDSGQVRQLFNESIASKPNYSPHGDMVAFIAGGLHKRLYTLSLSDQKVTCLNPNYPDSLSDSIYTDMSFRDSSWKPLWSDDGKYIYVLSGHHGTNEIVRFTVNADEPPLTVIGGPRTITDFSFDGKSTIIATYTAPHIPSQISSFKIHEEKGITRTSRQPTDDINIQSAFFPKQETKLDDSQQSFLEKVNLAQFETFQYKSVDDWTIHGFLLKPANFNPNQQYPLVLDIHGGPHSTHGYAYFHQMQVLAAEGYAVVYVNPRGSSGYGEAFTEAVINDYGGKDTQDILTGLDEALKRYDFLDQTRMAVSGLSYGGFMTNWIITKTNRFKAAISEGGVSNWVSIYGTGDVDPGMTNEDLPDKNDIASLWAISPLKYVDKIDTPILMIHAEDDHRVPIEQSEQLYTYVKSQGKEARLVLFPNSSHLLLQIGDPDKKVARLEEMVNWLKRYV